MTPEEMILSHDEEIVNLGISILKEKNLSNEEIGELVNENKNFILFDGTLLPKYSKSYLEKIIKGVFE